MIIFKIKKLTLYISIILQIHTFTTATTYIMQWISMWTVWDRYTSDDWRLMLVVSIAALLAVIALMGHPCDLVCAPFILSYDSMEYNIRIGSPFLTEKVMQLNSFSRCFFFSRSVIVSLIFLTIFSTNILWRFYRS